MVIAAGPSGGTAAESTAGFSRILPGHAPARQCGDTADEKRGFVFSLMPEGETTVIFTGKEQYPHFPGK
jgi:hypothetical protein